MTCIVGYVENDKVYIGGDSAAVSNINITIRKDPKVFMNSEYLIGFTSSFRMGQLLMYCDLPRIRPDESDIYKFMCTEFINKVRSVFRKNGYSTVESSVEYGGVFLVGYKGRLFKIYSDFQVAESYEPFASCGCGEDYALGAMHMIHETNLTPEEKIEKSLMCAEHFSGGVSKPFIIKNI